MKFVHFIFVTFFTVTLLSIFPKSVKSLLFGGDSKQTDVTVEFAVKQEIQLYRELFGGSFVFSSKSRG